MQKEGKDRYGEFLKRIPVPDGSKNKKRERFIFVFYFPVIKLALNYFFGETGNNFYDLCYVMIMILRRKTLFLLRLEKILRIIKLFRHIEYVKTQKMLSFRIRKIT